MRGIIRNAPTASGLFGRSSTLRGLLQRSIILNAKVAADYHIGLVHEQGHINLIKNISSRPIQSRRRIANSFNSIYFSEGSTEAAYLAAGSVIEVADKVAKGELDYAFAIVRPPGHHAEMDKPMGFCLYNNVGVTASFLLNERMDLGIRKILIVDWDIHHGNGTHKMFYDDPRVLFFSVHRHNFGHFYPVGNDGSYIKTGAGPGVGFNINVPWEHGGCGDADYLAVWNYILLPVAKEFNPDIILISAGFDAAVNDPIGECCVTPIGYTIMLKKLMESVGGKIVMALEGGYNLVSLAESVQKCVGALLGDTPDMNSSGAAPYGSTWRVIEQVRHALSAYWPILASRLPEEVITRTTKTHELIAYTIALQDRTYRRISQIEQGLNNFYARYEADCKRARRERFVIQECLRDLLGWVRSARRMRAPPAVDSDDSLLAGGSDGEEGSGEVASEDGGSAADE